MSRNTKNFLHSLPQARYSRPSCTGSHSDKTSYLQELELLKEGQDLPKTSFLLTLHPFMDSLGLLHVGGREQKSNRSYSSQHPILLSGNILQPSWLLLLSICACYTLVLHCWLVLSLDLSTSSGVAKLFKKSLVDVPYVSVYQRNLKLNFLVSSLLRESHQT